MPAIEAFAEIDTASTSRCGCIKRHAGRLAFSIATAVRPDVLIVDEALVGRRRHQFQHKCGSNEGVQEQGTTMLAGVARSRRRSGRW